MAMWGGLFYGVYVCWYRGINASTLTATRVVPRRPILTLLYLHICECFFLIGYLQPVCSPRVALERTTLPDWYTVIGAAFWRCLYPCVTCLVWVVSGLQQQPAGNVACNHSAVRWWPVSWTDSWMCVRDATTDDSSSVAIWRIGWELSVAVATGRRRSNVYHRRGR